MSSCTLPAGRRRVDSFHDGHLSAGTLLSGVLGLIAALTAGCGGAPSASELAPVTTLNGSVPPGTLARLIDESEMMRTSDGQGHTILVMRGTRVAGTRAALHTHPYGGTTCVLQGRMTLYMEGASPSAAEAGTCYFMPPGMMMAASNQSAVDSIIMDYFVVPDGQPAWTVVEPYVTDPNGHFD